MPDSTPSQSSPLPWDVLIRVYRHSAQSTLAALCLVSRETLEDVGPLLYRHLELRTLDQAQRLFCKVVRRSAFSVLDKC